MFLIKDTNSKDENNIVFTERSILGSIFINLYLIVFALIDIFYLKMSSIKLG
jgi:hypothetical protein